MIDRINGYFAWNSLFPFEMGRKKQPTVYNNNFHQVSDDYFCRPGHDNNPKNITKRIIVCEITFFNARKRAYVISN